MFRAPLDSFYTDPAPPFVDQLFSGESLAERAISMSRPCNTGGKRSASAPGSNARTGLEMGLVAVSTQLWHHTFINGGLADLPSLAMPPASAGGVVTL